MASGILIHSITNKLHNYMVYGFNRAIGLMSKVFANSPEDWVQSQVESYQRLKKWYLIPSSLILSILW